MTWYEIKESCMIGDPGIDEVEYHENNVSFPGFLMVRLIYNKEAQ